MRYCIDLHNHSCLSPCASDDLLPSLVAFEAKERGIDIVALTDHNSARNLEPFSEACEIVGITGIYGIEVNTIEDIHLLALFEHLNTALEFGLYIESILPKVKNNRRLFGNQLITDIAGNIIQEWQQFLYAAANASFDQLVKKILDWGGLAIPAHIDRPSNSVIANLGFLPKLPYSALELIVYPPTVETDSYTVIQGSDAHYINHIGRRCCFIESEKEGFVALKDAFATTSVSFLANS
ncbi:MAG: PHP domain-containing protein [Sphaerochaetaceae bacterium]